MDHDTAERLGIDVSRTRGYNHWTRNLVFSPDGRKLYVAVGSATNATPNDDPRRAAINEYDVDGEGHRVYAAGVRNPVGMVFHPETGVMWATVQERDHLGDDLVPDFMTSIQDGGFYGWPYAYIGSHPEPILNGARPDLVERSLMPDVLLGSHSAALGMAFYTGSQFPQEYRGSAFVALHGSINRSVLAGYSVVRIPFRNGRPSGEPVPFLDGYVVKDDGREKVVWGRPVDVLQAADGSLLISDDGGNRIWRVSHIR
jgi:glucose/arabinose dehydrogenase